MAPSKYDLLLRSRTAQVFYLPETGEGLWGCGLWGIKKKKKKGGAVYRLRRPLLVGRGILAFFMLFLRGALRSEAPVAAVEQPVHFASTSLLFQNYSFVCIGANWRLTGAGRCGKFELSPTALPDPGTCYTCSQCAKLLLFSCMIKSSEQTQQPVHSSRTAAAAVLDPDGHGGLSVRIQYSVGSTLVSCSAKTAMAGLKRLREGVSAATAAAQRSSSFRCFFSNCLSPPSCGVMYEV